jgi:hypothetical protein
MSNEEQTASPKPILPEHSAELNIVVAMMRTQQDHTARLADAVLALSNNVRAMSHDLESLSKAARSNTDTTPEEYEKYMNKIARMLASDRYQQSAKFLRNCFKWSEASGIITRKQMRAIDNMEARPAANDLNIDDCHYGDPFPED